MTECGTSVEPDGGGYPLDHLDTVLPGVPPMEATLNMDLTEEQRTLVLEGLRYVRSSRKLAFRDPLAPPDPQREGDLRVVNSLLERLDPRTLRGNSRDDC